MVLENAPADEVMSPLVAVALCGLGDLGGDAPVAARPCRRLFETLFEASPAAVMITDGAGRILAVNPAFCRLTGYDAAEVMGQSPSLLKSGRHDAAFYRAMWDSLGQCGEWSGEVWDRRRDGSVYPKWLHIRAVPGAPDAGRDRPEYYLACFTDLSAHKQAEERIHLLAYHDPLTGLPNRLLLMDRLEHALAQADRQERGMALLFIDLDGFKNVNDSLGHAMGDELLKEVATRLRHCVREADTVARLGGDEFIIVMEGMDGAATAGAVAHKINAAFTRPVGVGGQALHASASIGIALYPQDGESADILLRNADTAMYQAKARGRGNHQFFAPIMNQRAREKLDLENTLLGALERREFRLYYQPIVDARSGALASAEALIRWESPERGLVPPDKFIPIAEETGTILPIGDWVIRRACRDLAVWKGAGLALPRVSVNISPRQFHQAGLAQRIRAYLEAFGLDAACLELEVTESALMEYPEQAARLLGELKDLGMGIVLDDFGTGYSSLSYLKKFPVDKLKIDRSFVRDLLEDKNDREITLAVIALSHNLGLRVTAEGVETPEQLAFLRTYECDYAQGYLFDRPLTARAFTEAMMAGRFPPSGD